MVDLRFVELMGLAEIIWLNWSSEFHSQGEQLIIYLPIQPYSILSLLVMGTKLAYLYRIRKSLSTAHKVRDQNENMTFWCRSFEMGEHLDASKCEYDFFFLTSNIWSKYHWLSCSHPILESCNILQGVDTYYAQFLANNDTRKVRCLISTKTTASKLTEKCVFFFIHWIDSSTLGMIRVLFICMFQFP